MRPFPRILEELAGNVPQGIALDDDVPVRRIAAYIRAVQLSQRAPRDILSAEDLDALRSAPVAAPEIQSAPGKIGSQIELGPRGGTPQPGSFGPGAGEVVR